MKNNYDIRQKSYQLRGAFGADKAFFMVVLIFNEHVFTLWSNWFIALEAFMSNVFSEASFTEWLLLVDNILLACKRHIAVMACKMFNMPCFVHCFCKLADIDQLQ